jgi:hypothetical protein
MKSIRQLHFYLGTFFAPAIFFFAFSGALQTFGLHESEDGSNYSPPSWIVTLASIHKDQMLAKPHKPHLHASPTAKAENHPEDAQKPAEDGEQPPSHSAFPLKCFVLLLAIGLMTSAALGIYLALQSRNNRRMAWIMLASGILLPIGLIFL